MDALFRCRALLRALPLLIAGWTAGNVAAAETVVYRCGPDGRLFSQAPCADGRRIEVEAARPSTAARREAEAVAQRDARLAREMASERVAREQAASRVGAAGIRHVVLQPREPAVGQSTKAGQRADKGPVKDNGGRSTNREKRPKADQDSRSSFAIQIPAPRKDKAPKDRVSSKRPGPARAS